VSTILNTPESFDAFCIEVKGKGLCRTFLENVQVIRRSMNNIIKLQHYYFPGELEQAIREFVEYYNHQRYNESLDNLTSADVYYGRGKKIIIQREIYSGSHGLRGNPM
jgi:hypothetical protein